MKTIYKYPIPTDGLVEIEMPIDSQILTVQIQNGNPFIWALVDTDKPKELKTFCLFPTGCEMEMFNKMDRFYIGTFQLNDGAYNYVLHLFEHIQRKFIIT